MQTHPVASPTHTTNRVPGRRTPARRPAPRTTIKTRRGSLDDLAALVAMHERCSAETVYRRYHTPTPHLSDRLARTMLEPVDGWSIVAASGQGSTSAVHAVAMLAGYGDRRAEIGIVVEDVLQRQGVGSRMLRALACQAAESGIERLTVEIHADNAAMFATIRTAGLSASVANLDGVRQATVPIGHLREIHERRENKITMGELTTPLVSLLHQRRDLRGISGPADLIDQAVRAGA